MFNNLINSFTQGFTGTLIGLLLLVSLLIQPAYQSLKMVWTLIAIVVYLFSAEMFALILPFSPLIAVLTFGLNSLGFFFYTKHANKKVTDTLNKFL